MPQDLIEARQDNIGYAVVLLLALHNFIPHHCPQKLYLYGTTLRLANIDRQVAAAAAQLPLVLCLLSNERAPSLSKIVHNIS